MAFLKRIKNLDYKKISYVLGGVVLLAVVFYGYVEWGEKVEKDLSLRIDQLLLKQKTLIDQINPDNEDDEAVKSLVEGYKKIYQDYPNRINGVRALFLSSDLEMRMGLYQNARENFEIIVEEHPQHFLAPRSFLNLALLDKEEERIEAALSKLESFNQRFPNNYLKNEVSLTLGRLYLQLENYSLAKNYFDEVLINAKANKTIENAQEKIDYLLIKGYITNQ